LPRLLLRCMELHARLSKWCDTSAKLCRILVMYLNQLSGA
jgi:hypothetical protein